MSLCTCIIKRMKPVVATALKKTCLFRQYYRHCSNTAIFFKKLTLLICNNEKKLKVTLKFTLAKVTKGDFNVHFSKSYL